MEVTVITMDTATVMATGTADMEATGTMDTAMDMGTVVTVTMVVTDTAAATMVVMDTAAATITATAMDRAAATRSSSPVWDMYGFADKREAVSGSGASLNKPPPQRHE